MTYKSTFVELDKDLMECCRQGYLHLLPDGKMRMMLTKFHLSWYHIRLYKRDCLYWSSIMNLPMFGKGQSFVPIACLNCWKVVARPRNYDEARKLLGHMKTMGYPSKIGTEQRNTVPALWGAYFYSDTKEEGLDCYKIVREVVNTISRDIPVLLKRGCTEYEQGLDGPSDKWGMFPGQVKFEKYISDKIEIMQANHGQSDFLKEMVLENWKRWAHSTGDLSYVPYNNGERLTPEYVTYHS